MANKTGLTTILSNTSFTLTEEMGIRSISMSLLSGTVTYVWDKPIAGITPMALTLIEGEYPNITSQKAINGFTIIATSGEVKLIMSE